MVPVLQHNGATDGTLGQSEFGQSGQSRHVTLHEVNTKILPSRACAATQICLVTATSRSDYYNNLPSAAVVAKCVLRAERAQVASSTAGSTLNQLQAVSWRAFRVSPTPHTRPHTKNADASSTRDKRL